MDKHKNLIFVLPALTGTFIFIVIPIFCSFALSFTEWDLLNEIKFVGLDNYKSILSEPEFLQILLNTFVYAISTTIFAVIIPLLIAAALNTKIRGCEVYKTIYFLPFITPAVVLAIVWSWIFDPNIGGINLLFKTHLNWLFDTHLAMPVLIFVSVWKLIGYNVVLFLTGLVCWMLCRLCNFGVIINILIKIVICSVIPNVAFCICFWKTEELQYLLERLKDIIGKIIRFRR